MENRLGMAYHLTNQTMRTVFYSGLWQLTNRLTPRGPQEAQDRPRTAGPVPSLRRLFEDLMQFLVRDATLVRDGILPPIDNQSDPFPTTLNRIQKMFRDLPNSNERRMNRDGQEVSREQPHAELPDYFVQNFHYQTGGYLTSESARLYDVQVETLFLGSCNAMRRQALKPIAAHLKGRDQRKTAVLDVACGTGRFLAQLLQVYPRIAATGLDLSLPYLTEARRYTKPLRLLPFIHASAEEIAVKSGSVDIVTCMFLFHELPPDVRRTVIAEMSRVLKPGGLLVFIDSLQLGDQPDYDGLLRAFPVRFHEPYYLNYIIDDLNDAFRKAGLIEVYTEPAFLSKVMVRRKAG